MYAATLLADHTRLRLERIVSSATSLTLAVRTTGLTAACPNCGAVSGRVHSRYVRQVADLPWHGVSVRLDLHARKFFCPDPDCPRRVFTGRLPRVVAPHARRTRRLSDALTLLAFALGGEPGARAVARVAGAGLPGSKEVVRYHLSRWRAQLPAHLRYSRGVPQPQPPAPPSPRRAAWMLLKAEGEPKAGHRAFTEGLCGLCPEVAAAARLAREFSRMVRGKCAWASAGWLDAAAGSGVAEFEGFTAGLRRDQEAVAAALSCEWGNGQTEGQINRLKTIKRRTYGRAKFDLLRARVLHRAQA